MERNLKLTIEEDQSLKQILAQFIEVCIETEKDIKLTDKIEANKVNAYIILQKLTEPINGTHNS